LKNYAAVLASQALHLWTHRHLLPKHTRPYLIQSLIYYLAAYD